MVFVMAMRMGMEPRRLGDAELIARVRTMVTHSNTLEAELIAHLAEVDERRLYLPRWTSMWDFCLFELGFSESVAGNRIAIARESRRSPQVLETLRAGLIHVSGLRMLCGHLTPEGGEALLREAAGKTKRQIEEMLAGRFPKAPVPDRIRKVPTQAKATGGQTEPAGSQEAPGGSPTAHARVAPLSAEAYRVQFTASRALRDKIREVQDLLRHQFPSGDLAQILDRALTLLIAQVKKERFGVGSKPRRSGPRGGPASTRRVPTAIRRAVFERDGGRCTYVDSEGRRCEAKGLIQLDHAEGFARKPEHRLETIRLLCAPHNQYEADQMYGKEWMDQKREQQTAEKGTSRRRRGARARE